MSPEFKVIYGEAVKRDPEAMRLIEQLFDVLHFWDDLIDGDKELTADDIHDSMWKALVEVPSNGFFQRNFQALMPILRSAVFNWQAANKMELDGGELEKQVAFILRSTYVDFATACAYIVGGREWAERVAHVVRLETSREGFTEFLAALTRENRKDK